MENIKKYYVAFILSLWIAFFISLADGSFATLLTYWQYAALGILFVLTILAVIPWKFPGGDDDTNYDHKPVTSASFKSGGKPTPPPPAPNIVRMFLSIFYEFEDERSASIR